MFTVPVEGVIQITPLNYSTMLHPLIDEGTMSPSFLRAYALRVFTGLCFFVHSPSEQPHRLVHHQPFPLWHA